MEKFNDIDSYIASFSQPVRERLEQVRETIRNAVPEAGERISYGMPTFFLNGVLLYFGAFRHHIGLYNISEHDEVSDELKRYKTGKGSVQFPHAEPLPVKFIIKMSKIRAKENEAKKDIRKF